MHHPLRTLPEPCGGPPRKRQPIPACRCPRGRSTHAPTWLQQYGVYYYYPCVTHRSYANPFENFSQFSALFRGVSPLTYLLYLG